MLEDKLPVLARELAMGIYEVEDILGRYGISWGEFERIQGMARFQRLLETTTVEWGSTLNTRERIKVKALAGVEDGLAGLFMSAKDTRETLASRVEAYKLARVLAGIGEKDPNEIPQEKFTLTINIGDEKTVVGGPAIDVTPGPQNLRESVLDAPEKDTGQLFEFTSEVTRAPQEVIQARVRALTTKPMPTPTPTPNDDLRSGYDDERHGDSER